jgi:hypothetical protein
MADKVTSGRHALLAWPSQHQGHRSLVLLTSTRLPLTSRSAFKSDTLAFADGDNHRGGIAQIAACYPLRPLRALHHRARLRSGAAKSWTAGDRAAAQGSFCR